MQLIRNQWLLSALMFFALCNTSLADQAVPAKMAPASTPAQLHQVLTKLIQENAIPGVSYAVFDRDGTQLSDIIGVADSAVQNKVTQSTLFRIGSITKPVTAIAIMELIEQGHFTLQTPVSKLLPSAPITNAFAEPVRVVHLLAHTAGFDDTRPKSLTSKIEGSGKHLDALQREAAAFVVRWQPGQYHSYSNLGYALLGAILEAHYQQRWDEIIARQVLTPLGMTQAATSIDAARTRDHANSHRGKMQTVGLIASPFQADGALWASAADLAKLGRFLLTEGASAPALLKSETVRNMKQVQASAAAEAGLAYGMNGLGLRHRIFNGTQWQGHTGAELGTRSSMQFQDQLGMGFVLLVNSENELRALEEPIAAYLMAQRGLKMPQVPTVPIEQEINGWFRSVNSRAEIIHLVDHLNGIGHISTKGDELKIEPFLPGLGIEGTFKHHGNGLLADVEYGSVIDSVIVRDKAGKLQGIQLGPDSYLVPVSFWSAVLPQLSVLLALPLLLSAPFGRRRALSNPWLRRLPLLALLTLLFGIVCALNLRFEISGSINWQTLGIFAASTLFPVFAVTGVLNSVRTWRTETACVAKWRALLGSLGALVLALWFAAFHWFALPLWSF